MCVSVSWWVVFHYELDSVRDRGKVERCVVEARCVAQGEGGEVEGR